MNNQDKSISKSYLEQNDTLKNLFDSSLIDFESLFENEDTVVFNANDLLKVMHIFQSNKHDHFSELAISWTISTTNKRHVWHNF